MLPPSLSSYPLRGGPALPLFPTFTLQTPEASQLCLFLSPTASPPDLGWAGGSGRKWPRCPAVPAGGTTISSVVQEKEGSERNVYFSRDFKMLADVLTPEVTKNEPGLPDKESWREAEESWRQECSEGIQSPISRREHRAVKVTVVARCGVCVCVGGAMVRVCRWPECLSGVRMRVRIGN